MTLWMILIIIDGMDLHYESSALLIFMTWYNDKNQMRIMKVNVHVRH